MHVSSRPSPYTLPQHPRSYQHQLQQSWQVYPRRRRLDTPDDDNGEPRSRYSTTTDNDISTNQLALLKDRRIAATGDLGWSLNYATAYCYRFLNSNRFAIVAAVNDARKMPVTMQTPFILFNTLDTALFAAKLSGMVLMGWKAMGSGHLGLTYATNVIARRICIQLNCTPFEERSAGMYTLMEMLVHQMIHAYYLVCCGAQKAGEKQDGRMIDGVHFGVIMTALNDITQECHAGSMGMSFHAAARRTDATSSSSSSSQYSKGRGDFICLDPAAMSILPPLVDGKSHCMHDNRSITRAHVMNWQVQEYARAIHDDGESRGEHVFFWIDSQHCKMRRLDGPPSKYYSELIWDGKRFATPKEQVTKYAALKRMASDSKFGDMKVPECSAEVFECLWKFVVAEGYNPTEFVDQPANRARAGPPVLLSPHSSRRRGESMKLHIQMCKLADSMRFPELRQYALRRLYELPATSDDPMAMLRDIYDPAKPLSVELQSWTRKFLARIDDGGRESTTGTLQQPWQARGMSNYEKIYEWHQPRFTELYVQHATLRDDCTLVVAGLSSGISLQTEEHTPEAGSGNRPPLPKGSSIVEGATPWPRYPNIAYTNVGPDRPMGRPVIYDSRW